MLYWTKYTEQKTQRDDSLYLILVRLKCRIRPLDLKMYRENGHRNWHRAKTQRNDSIYLILVRLTHRIGPLDHKMCWEIGKNAENGAKMMKGRGWGFYEERLTELSTWWRGWRRQTGPWQHYVTNCCGPFSSEEKAVSMSMTAPARKYHENVSTRGPNELGHG